MSAPNASVVAVADGRILKLGASRKLGRYVILRDIYGDVFTYAGLGSIAKTYTPPKTAPTPISAPSAPLSNAHGAAGSEAVGPGGHLPLPLKAAPPKLPATTARPRSSSAASSASSAAPFSATGKVRLFAHP